MTTDTQNILSDVLGQLIAFDADARAVWPAEALKDLLGRYLHTPLTTSPQHRPLTFAQLLEHPHPPPDLLWRTKEFAKRNSHDRNSMIPPELCLVLYYGCIMLALVRCRQRITRLSERDLREGVEWVVRQPWVDEQTRRFFSDALPWIDRRAGRWRC